MKQYCSTPGFLWYDKLSSEYPGAVQAEGKDDRRIVKRVSDVYSKINETCETSRKKMIPNKNCRDL